VIAIGSGYPIPIKAEKCPFTGAPQPELLPDEDLDLDEDGMKDLWEEKYGLDPSNAGDAGQDPDNDGFTNLEEFIGGTDPRDAASFPPKVAKLRMEKLINTPFKFLFKSVSELVPGVKTFALNLRDGGKTYFVEEGQEVMERDPMTGEERPTGVVIKSYERIESDDPAVPARETLTLQQGGREIALERGKVVQDFEIKAELVYLVDQRRMTKRIGEVIELEDDRFEVLGISREGVSLKSRSTGQEVLVPPASRTDRRSAPQPGNKSSGPAGGDLQEKMKELSDLMGEF
jgi:hypothetical protein